MNIFIHNSNVQVTTSKPKCLPTTIYFSLALASTSQEDTAKAQSTSRAILGGDNQRNAALPIQLRSKRTFGVATGEGKHLIPPAKRRKSIAPSTQRVVQPQVFGFEGNKHECRPVTQISCASTKRVTKCSSDEVGRGKA